ncbi:hypothetical protein V3A08_07470 [Tenacibaculum maritimum]|uniref:hypothetical protein n=1 Tax=Tenacibaculum maritimum TaxID=107401 RepID=UPI003876D095
MAKIKSKEEALSKLSQLDEKVLIRMADLSENKKARSYFSCPLKYGAVKSFLNK